MKYLTTPEIAEKWNISRRRVSKLCAEGRINGAKQIGDRWIIPACADKPCDMRRRIKTKINRSRKNGSNNNPGL